VTVVQSLLDRGQVEPDVGSMPHPVLALLLDIAVARQVVRAFFALAWKYVLKIAYQPDTRGDYPYLEEIARYVAEGPTELGPQATAASELLALGTKKATPPKIRIHQDLRPLAEAWRALPDAGRVTVGRRLPAALLGKSMTPESFRVLITVTETLEPAVERRSDTPGLHELVEAEVGDRLLRHPDLLPRLALDENWARELVRYAPQYAWLTEWFVVHRMASEADTSAMAVGDSYMRLRSAAAPPGAAVRAIGPWLAARGPEGLDELLCRFPSVSDNSLSPREEVRFGAFTDPELRGLGVAYEWHMRQRRDVYQAGLQHCDQELAANRELMLDGNTRQLMSNNNIPLPPDFAVSPSQDPPAASQGKPNPLKRALNALRGDH
jgi:hypothetical protein